MRVRHAAASDVGLVRKQNEDSFVAGGGIFAVCDGMGGARAGEVASELACAALVELNVTDAGRAELEEVVQRANTIVWRRGHEDPSLTGMGTTMTVALMHGDTLLIGHVGDSRAYRWRAGRLDQLTDDHSLVGELVRQGQLTPEQAEVHPQRSIITRALGTESVVELDTFVVGLEPGDRVLLCSDGLSGMVPGHEIAEVLSAGDDPQTIADALVAKALAHGGEDNVTVVVLLAVADGGDDLAGAAQGVGGLDVDDPYLDRPVVGPFERHRADAGGRGGPLGMRRLRPRVERVLHESVDSREAADRGRGRRPPRIVVAGAVVLLLAAAAVIAVAVVNSTVYFVGTSEDGRVALFQGLPIALLGIELASVVEPTAVPVDSLRPYLQERVRAEDLVTKEEGLLFIRSLEDTTTSSPAGASSTAPVPTTTSTGTSPSAPASPTATAPATAPADESSPVARPSTTSTAG